MPEWMFFEPFFGVFGVIFHDWGHFIEQRQPVECPECSGSENDPTFTGALISRGRFATPSLALISGILLCGAGVVQQ